ncbi:MAG: GNAT family N-acetyltransferase [Patescibacteria group bacterium]|nr:GNAT family N-acetyltransferase [Patescibacteria group bacterium]
MQIKHIQKFDPDLIKSLFAKAGECDVTLNQRFFDNNNNILLISFYDSEPTGFLYAYIIEGLKANRSKIFLYSIDVFEKFQKQGVGTQLIKELKKIAKKRLCHEVFVMTNKNNTAAMKLYKKTGGKIEKDDDVLFVYSQ